MTEKPFSWPRYWKTIPAQCLPPVRRVLSAASHNKPILYNSFYKVVGRLLHPACLFVLLRSHCYSLQEFCTKNTNLIIISYTNGLIFFIRLTNKKMPDSLLAKVIRHSYMFGLFKSILFLVKEIYIY